MGRRTELQLGALLYMAGAALEGSAGHIHFSWGLFRWVGLLVFLVGRLIYGFGIGIAMHAAPTYLGEMCPSSIRGLLVSLKEACIVLGMVLGYTIGNAADHHWSLIYFSTLGASGIMWILATFAIPESARYLLLQNPLKYEQQALLSLEFVFPQGPYALEQLREIQASLQQEEQVVGRTTPLQVSSGNDSNAPPSSSSSSSPWSTLLHPQYRLPLTAGLGLVLLQQVTGQPSVLSYATQILQQAGLTGSAAIPIALFKLVATLIAASTVETFGRVQLLGTGCSLMLVALVLLSLSFSSVVELPKGLVLGALFLYIGGYQVGFGPITWLMTSEVFPLAIRGQAVALAVQFNFLFNAAVQFGVPVLQQAVGLSWTFGIFALLDLYSLYFIRTFVPETKGLSLEEIEEKFGRMTRGSSRDEPVAQQGSMTQNRTTALTEPLLQSAPTNYETNGE